MVSTAAFVMSGLIIGAAFGFVLQRGRFCMNSAYREVLFGDYMLLRAYLLAVVIAMIGANLIEDLGWLRHVDEAGALVTGELQRQAFVPWANIIGGYLFGMGIVLAGGCGSGIVYRIGEGNLAYVFAVFSFFFGISATKFGTLKPLYDLLLSMRWPKEGPAPTLYSVLGVNKWVVIAGISAVFLLFVFQGSRSESEEGIFLVRRRPSGGPHCRGRVVGVRVFRWSGTRSIVHRAGAGVLFCRDLRQLPERSLGRGPC
jgi:uncharacterized membrane protein YedE/YeeE